MKVDFSTIDRTRFHVNERTIAGRGDFVLIVPYKAMWDWNESELDLRSLLCRPDGTVISAGFPKFFNYGENSQHDYQVTSALNAGRTVCLEKLDGSLIIRSVIDGVVHFRTRGSELIASDMRDDVKKLIGEKYKFLLDPTLEPDVSLLMEYCAPNNQIVIKYDEAQLVLLAAVDFSGNKLVVKKPPNLQMRTPKAMVLPSNPQELIALVKQFIDGEGIVVWAEVNNEIILSKFKSAWYLRLHSIRSQVTPRYLREYCFVNNISTLEELKSAFLKEGFDWEIVSYVEPIFNEFKSENDIALKKKDIADRIIALVKEKNSSRKDIAVALKSASSDQNIPELFSYMIADATGDTQRAIDIFDAYRLDMNINQLRMLKKEGVKLNTEVKADD